MGASFTFCEPENLNDIIKGVTIKVLKHTHPGGAYTYRVEEKGKTFVYCTDIEHLKNIKQNDVDIAKHAVLLIHDSQYTPEKLNEKKGWGHSSYLQTIELAKKANVKKLALTHNDPESCDQFLLKIKKHFPKAFLAKEGL